MFKFRWTIRWHSLLYDTRLKKNNDTLSKVPVFINYGAFTLCRSQRTQSADNGNVKCHVVDCQYLRGLFPLLSTVIRAVIFWGVFFIPSLGIRTRQRVFHYRLSVLYSRHYNDQLSTQNDMLLGTIIKAENVKNLNEMGYALSEHLLKGVSEPWIGLDYDNLEFCLTS